MPCRVNQCESEISWWLWEKTPTEYTSQLQMLETAPIVANVTTIVMTVCARKIFYHVLCMYDAMYPLRIHMEENKETKKEREGE